MNEKKKIIIRVGGREVTLISSDPPEYLRRVERYLDRRLSETALAAHMPVASATLMTAISMADDLLKAQDENDRLRREILALREEMTSSVLRAPSPEGEG